MRRRLQHSFILLLALSVTAPANARIADESGLDDSGSEDLLSLETDPYLEVPVEETEDDRSPESGSSESDYSQPQRPYDMIEYSPSVYAPIPQTDAVYEQPPASYEQSRPTYVLSSEPHIPYRAKNSYQPPPSASSPAPAPRLPPYPVSRPYEPKYSAASLYKRPPSPQHYQPRPPPAPQPSHPPPPTSDQTSYSSPNLDSSREYQRPDLYAIIETAPHTQTAGPYPQPPAPSVLYSPKPQYTPPAPYAPPPATRPHVEYKPHPAPTASHYSQPNQRPQYTPSYSPPVQSKSEAVRSPYYAATPPPAYSPPTHRPQPYPRPETQPYPRPETHPVPHYPPHQRPSYEPPVATYSAKPGDYYRGEQSHPAPPPAAYPYHAPRAPVHASPSPAIRYPPPTPYVPPVNQAYAATPPPLAYPSAYNSYNRHSSPYKSA